MTISGESKFDMPGIGEILAFLTAVVWAFAVILFKKSGEQVHPLALNLFKNTFAFILFTITLAISNEVFLYNAPSNEYWLMLVSGVIGIGIADTLFFESLNRLGAGLTAIVDCLYSPFIITLSFIFLGETMSIRQIIGAAMIISAILFTIQAKEKLGISKKNLILGFTYGALCHAFMAIGIVMIKPILDHSPILWTIEVRLIGGITFLLLYFAIHPKRNIFIRSLITKNRWSYTISGSFVGTYIATLIWLGGMKYTQASTASALNQTSNIFLFILAAVFLKEKIDLRRTIAILVAISGAFLIIFG